MEYCFLRVSVFSEMKTRETLRLEGSRIHCFPGETVMLGTQQSVEHSLRVYLIIHIFLF